MMPSDNVKDYGAVDVDEVILEAMPPIDGEVREVLRCGICGQLYGRRYIPYGIGEGLTVNACRCLLTGNQRNNHSMSVRKITMDDA